MNKQKKYFSRKRFCAVFKKEGFTLIELLIALALYAVALTLLIGGLRGGLSVWQRDRDAVSPLQEAQVFLLKVGDELQDAVVFEPVPFQGRENEMEMSTLLGKPTENGMQKQWAKVRYWKQGDQLMREESDLAALLQETKYYKRKRGRRTVWLEGVRDLSFQYAYQKEKGGVIWEKDWKPSLQTPLPLGIKVRLELQPDQGSPVGMEKIVLLPDGSLRPASKGAA